MKSRLFLLALGLSISSLVFSSEELKCDRSSEKSPFEQLLDAAQKDRRAFGNPKVQTSYGSVRIWIKTNGPRVYIKFDGPDDSHVEDLRNGEKVIPVSEKLLSSDLLLAAAYAQMYLAGLAGMKSEYPDVLQDFEFAALQSQIAKAEHRVALLKKSFLRTKNYGVWECSTSGCTQISEEEYEKVIEDAKQYYIDHAKQYDAEMANQR